MYCLNSYTPAIKRKLNNNVCLFCQQIEITVFFNRANKIKFLLF